MPRRMSESSDKRSRPSGVSGLTLHRPSMFARPSMFLSHHHHHQHHQQYRARFAQHRRDKADVLSLEPSYTKFHVPYSVHCEERYQMHRLEYEKQFRHEIRWLLALQSSALEAVLFRRHMSRTSLWPPLHNARELAHLKEYIHPQPSRRRINYLMKNVIT